MSAAQQLELFSEPAVGNIYRVGDWVKTKRKPEIAAHIKRGECFRVNAVHPENGSVKIWNPLEIFASCSNVRSHQNLVQLLSLLFLKFYNIP
jgi:hypothetical protein